MKILLLHPIAFTIGDAETQPTGLTVSGTSSNATLVPNANITFGGGTGANRNVVITPAAGESGTSTITVTVSDGTLTASTNFVLTVNANTAPTITAIAPQSTNENTPTPPIAFTIGDAETQPTGLTVSGTSSNATLVPNANITLVVEQALTVTWSSHLRQVKAVPLPSRLPSAMERSLLHEFCVNR